LISFIALISINLAIINLLPIPVLDGGHLLFFSIEAIKGSPVSIKVREIAQQIGLFLLILLMILVFYNDISRIFFS
jgi:regulator of sigma E protease